MRFSPRTLATAALLLGAMTMFAGCGDSAHLPAGMSHASSSVGAEGGTGIDAIDSVFGGDPGAVATTYATSLEDPVLGDGLEDVAGLDSLGSDNPLAAALTQLDDDQGAMNGIDMSNDPFDDGGDPQPVGYGGGYGYDDPYGAALVATSFDGGFGGYGGAAAFDPGMDAGMDVGPVDGFAGGAADLGGFDAGPVDMGGAGFGAVDVGGMDVGPVEAAAIF